MIKMEFLFKMVRGATLILAISALTLAAQPSHCCGTDNIANANSVVSRIDAAIDQLGAPAFVERETATRELLNRGSTAIPQLETALQGAKGEVRYRIRTILDRQLRSSDMITRRAAQQALVRIATSKDPASSQWARSILTPPGLPTPSPYAQQSPAEKQG